MNEQQKSDKIAGTLHGMTCDFWVFAAADLHPLEQAACEKLGVTHEVQWNLSVACGVTYFATVDHVEEAAQRLRDAGFLCDVNYDGGVINIYQ